MENTFDTIESLAGSFKAYLNNRLAAIKMSIAEKTSLVLSNLLAGIFVLFVFMLGIIFGSTALAFFLGACLGKTWAGFLIVAGLYLLAGIIVWLGRGKLIRLPIMNAILQQLFNTSDEKDQ